MFDVFSGIIMLLKIFVPIGMIGWMIWFAIKSYMESKNGQ